MVIHKKYLVNQSYNSFRLLRYTLSCITYFHCTPSLVLGSGESIHAKTLRVLYQHLMRVVARTFGEITVTCLCVIAVGQAKGFYFDKLNFLTDEQLNIDADSTIDKDKFYRWAVTIPTIGVVMFGIDAFLRLLWHAGLYIVLRKNS